MSSFEFVGAFLLDLFLGDPPRLPHPVRWMGKTIAWGEGRARRWASAPFAQKLAGVLLLLGLSALAYFTTAALLWGARQVHVLLGHLLVLYLAYTTLSIKSLRDAALAVFKPLSGGNLPMAREKVSHLVGRRTDSLDSPQIAQATVESVAESTSDGIVAPLFFLALGGVPLAMAYKAVNTLDSMIGYRTPAYLNLGWASARADDVANFIPSRLTGLLVAASAAVLRRGSWRASLKIMLRDGGKHPSLNSGYPEAAMAGALRIRLGGQGDHPHKPGGRPSLGDGQLPGPLHILHALSLMYGVSGLMLCLILAVWPWVR